VPQVRWKCNFCKICNQLIINYSVRRGESWCFSRKINRFLHWRAVLLKDKVFGNVAHVCLKAVLPEIFSIIDSAVYDISLKSMNGIKRVKQGVSLVHGVEDLQRCCADCRPERHLTDLSKHHVVWCVTVIL